MRCIIFNDFKDCFTNLHVHRPGCNIAKLIKVESLAITWGEHIALIFFSLHKNRRTKTCGQYSKALRIPPNGAFMPYVRSDVDWALLNFRLSFKLGSLVGWGPRQVAPLCPPLGGPARKTIFRKTKSIWNT